jgi:hypothetical protein
MSRHRYYAKMKGDIIITDPCYILKNGEQGERDWELSDYGVNLKALGLKKYISTETEEGDWSCITYSIPKSNTSEDDTNLNQIGQFCADSGMVAVMRLEEVLKYNPEFKDHLNTSSVTLIKDFDGEVFFHYAVDEDDPDNGGLFVIGQGNTDFYSDSQTRWMRYELKKAIKNRANI